MNTTKLYRKSFSYFSHSKQEDIVSGLEKKFYDTILTYSNDNNNMNSLLLKIKEFKHELNQAILNYYFEDELLEYLFSLGYFVDNYVNYVQEKNLKVEVSCPPFKTYALNNTITN